MLASLSPRDRCNSFGKELYEGFQIFRNHRPLATTDVTAVLAPGNEKV